MSPRSIHPLPLPPKTIRESTQKISVSNPGPWINELISSIEIFFLSFNLYLRVSARVGNKSGFLFESQNGLNPGERRRGTKTVLFNHTVYFITSVFRFVEQFYREIRFRSIVGLKGKYWSPSDSPSWLLFFYPFAWVDSAGEEFVRFCYTKVYNTVTYMNNILLDI